MSKNLILKKGLRLHRLLLWFAGAALLLFVLSALTHPLMIWTGPRAASFFPPQVKIDSETAKVLPDILAENNIETAAIVKVVAGETGPLFQISPTLNGDRRYFDPATRTELPDHDERQAVWLARYYSGLTDTPIRKIDIKTEFDSSYPPVNRLLPVYVIQFDTPDRKTLYIHTETSAMASYSNSWKATLQYIFQILHTWSWLDDVETLRLVAMSLMLLSILGMAITGIALLLLMKQRKIRQKSRRFHRLIAYAIALPLLASCLSGSLHLYWSSFNPDSRDKRLSPELALAEIETSKGTDWLARYKDIYFNAISLIEGPDGAYFYRLGIPAAQADTVVSRRQHFDGTPLEKSAIYVAVNTHGDAPLNDREMAVHYARTLLHKEKNISADASLITRFGPKYDFRNKRLPVWKVVFADAPEDILYIDPISGLLVDRMTSTSLFERYVFSWAHKWDFLVPLTGRPGRDILVFLFLFSLVLLAGMGIYLHRKSASRP
jgi:hypothetical protein